MRKIWPFAVLAAIFIVNAARAADVEGVNLDAAWNVLRGVKLRPGAMCDQRAAAWTEELTLHGFNPKQVTTYSVCAENSIYFKTDPGREGRWNFHTAPVLKTRRGYVVLDPAWTEGPISVTEWARRFGGAPVIHEPQSPGRVVAWRKFAADYVTRAPSYPERPTTTIPDPTPAYVDRRLDLNRAAGRRIAAARAEFMEGQPEFLRTRSGPASRMGPVSGFFNNNPATHEIAHTVGNVMSAVIVNRMETGKWEVPAGPPAFTGRVAQEAYEQKSPGWKAVHIAGALISGRGDLLPTPDFLQPKGQPWAKEENIVYPGNATTYLYADPDDENKKVFFNEEWYLKRYPDAAEAVRRGLFDHGAQHFIDIGYKEGHQGYAP